MLHDQKFDAEFEYMRARSELIDLTDELGAVALRGDSLDLDAATKAVQCAASFVAAYLLSDPG